jgi:drug/metabolite transporter (DMT)-like permease
MPSLPLYPALLALLGAALFGTSGLVARMGLLHGNARLGSLISIAVTAAFYWAVSPLLLPEVPWTAAALLLFGAVFAGIGLVSPGLSLFLSFEGNRRLGATVSGTIAATAPLFAAGSAVLLLGERMSTGIAAGTLAIVGGVMVLSWQGRGRRAWPLWAALFPLGAAFLRGGGQMAAKFGLAVAPAPFTAALVAYSISFVAVLLAYQLGATPLPRRGLRVALGGGVGWFALTGVLNGLALVCSYLALSAGRVVVVSPIVSTYPLFTFALSLVLRVERLGPRILAGVLLVVLGVIVVSTQ